MCVLVLITACYIFFCQKNRSPVVAIQMCLLTITYIGFSMRNIWKVSTGNTKIMEDQTPDWIWYPFCISQVLWLTQHWIFTAQYLKVSMIFELAFCVKTSAVVAKKQERECNFKVINIGAYVLLSLNLIAMITVKERLVMTVAFVVSTVLMTAILTISMHKLRKFSTLLAANGILASRFLLAIHLGGWWMASLLQVVITII